MYNCLRKYIIASFLFIPISINLFSQDNAINPNGYNIFYHENGTISSEGKMRDGKPDGYWKTYNEEGLLISQGNRKNFELDSLWEFFNEEGNLIMEINYLNGKKNGSRKIYRNSEIIEENFVNDIKTGEAKIYYSNGSLKKTIYYENGIEEGIAKEYDSEGRTITLITYKKGFITDRERINRFDQQNKKHGKWKYFYDSGILSLEGIYKHGIKHGYFKEFDMEGNLITTSKYVNGEKQEDVAELVKLEIRKDYYPNGNVKIIASYKEGIPEGVTREFNEEGEIEKAYVFKNGIIIGEGIMTEKGEKDGPWKEYFDDGKLKATGDYIKDKKSGTWNFYHNNGNIEQTGNYNDRGQLNGQWKWYYQNGNLLREESFYNGLADGIMTEYDEIGNIVASGEFIEGLENGFWLYNYGDIKTEGEYIDGLRNGLWKNFYKNDRLSFSGKYIDDNPNGRHIYYWQNGNIKEAGNYIMGRKDGEWKTLNEDGTLFMVISYSNGKEKKYDGIKINIDEDF